MKTKKSEKKLTLNKITIARLNGLEMRAVLGGTDCPTTLIETCNTHTTSWELETKATSTSC